MKQYKVGRYVGLSVAGFLVFAVGLMLTRLLQEPEGILQGLPYLCVGVGAGIFGGNLGTALKHRTLGKNPQAAKQMEVEQNDERNQAIRDKAKAKAYDLMVYVLAALLIAFALMSLDVVLVLTLVVVYLFFIGTNVWYLAKYHKEM